MRIRPLFPYLEHLITLPLPAFTLNFLLSHTLPNSLTSLHNFSQSATSAGSSNPFPSINSAAPTLSQASYSILFLQPNIHIYTETTMETTHNPVLIQHLPETTYRQPFVSGHMPYYLH